VKQNATTKVVVMTLRKKVARSLYSNPENFGKVYKQYASPDVTSELPL